MHEFSLVEQIIEIALGEMRRRDAARVHTVTVEVGALTGIVHDSMQFAFESMIEGTPAEGACLVIDAVPAACYCPHCAKEFNVAGYRYDCPDCGTTDGKILRGREMNIKSIEVS